MVVDRMVSRMGFVALAAAMVTLLAAISMTAHSRHSMLASKSQLRLLNPGEASGADKDPDDPWDYEHPRCRGLPTCSDSTGHPPAVSRRQQGLKQLQSGGSLDAILAGESKALAALKRHASSHAVKESKQPKKVRDVTEGMAGPPHLAYAPSSSQQQQTPWYQSHNVDPRFMDAKGKTKPIGDTVKKVRDVTEGMAGPPHMAFAPGASQHQQTPWYQSHNVDPRFMDAKGKTKAASEGVKKVRDAAEGMGGAPQPAYHTTHAVPHLGGTNFVFEGADGYHYGWARKPAAAAAAGDSKPAAKKAVVKANALAATTAPKGSAQWFRNKLIADYVRRTVPY